jgi:hypothetical protein
MSSNISWYGLKAFYHLGCFGAILVKIKAKEEVD